MGHPGNQKYIQVATKGMPWSPLCPKGAAQDTQGCPKDPQGCPQGPKGNPKWPPRPSKSIENSAKDPKGGPSKKQQVKLQYYLVNNTIQEAKLQYYLVNNSIQRSWEHDFFWELSSHAVNNTIQRGANESANVRPRPIFHPPFPRPLPQFNPLSTQRPSQTQRESKRFPFPC